MVKYDQYYQTENLFGNPYPELIDFLAEYPDKGKVLDLGCGQGRDSIPIARLGFEVVGIDNSKVGIEQMIKIAKAESLKLEGKVADIYKFEHYNEFDFVLLDSMFHFQKKDRKKETEFIKTIISKIKIGCLIIFCIQDTGKKVEVLKEVLNSKNHLEHITDKKFKYLFEDEVSGHSSRTEYRMIVVKKMPN